MLHLEPLRSDMIAIHSLDGALGRRTVIVRNEAKALGFAGVPIDVHRGRYDVSVWGESLGQIGISLIFILILILKPTGLFGSKV